MPAAYTENTLVAQASSVAPGAAAVVASIAAPPAGIYDVEVHLALTGTAETALSNLRLRENATNLYVLPSLSAVSLRLRFPRVEVNNGGGNLDVQAIAAAAGGSIYNVVLIATRIG
jgi:hypothetical protein